MFIKLRGRKFYLRMHVPQRFAAVEKRKQVWIALGTDSETEAKKKAAFAFQEQTNLWEALLQGQHGSALARYEAARELTKHHGFRFLASDRVADLPMTEIMARLNAASVDAKGTLDMTKAVAFLGAVEKPRMTLSAVLTDYWQLAEDKSLGKSAEQDRRSRLPREKAFRNLIGVVGDLPVQDITPEEWIDFRNWWFAKIRAGEVKAASANKDFSYLASTIRRVSVARKLGVDVDLKGITFEAGAKETRKPFSDKWIREKLLAPGALAGLNMEARCILLGMINTGYRPSEAQGLLPHHIRLDGNIPHIRIEPEGRKLKTAASRRVIPLTGVSLDAFRECKNGFPRYLDNRALSATVNKFLRQNGLLESDDHTIYGLRHAFEDRLLAADVDHRIRCDLMGHTIDRQRYGAGASLDKAHALLAAVAL